MPPCRRAGASVALETREDAVAFLQAAGFHAFVGDWVMGKTIGVASHAVTSHGIEVWERMVYIAPEQGGWVLHNLRRPGLAPTQAVPLREACQLAIRALKEDILRKTLP
jgi:hypothetical protein